MRSFLGDSSPRMSCRAQALPSPSLFGALCFWNSLIYSGNNNYGNPLRWTCVYPIYIDAKRAYGTGERRIARAKSLWWPLSKDIAEATNRLGLGTLHEMNKSHPRDWENPGRVRVQWKKDGRLVNPAIKSSAYTRSHVTS